MNHAAILSREQISDAVHNSLRNWHNAAEIERQLCGLALCRQLMGQGAPAQQLILAGLDQLAETNAEGALILRLHFIDNQKVHTIARQLSLHEGTVHRKQRDALDQLSEFIYQREASVRERRIGRALSHLEQPTYLRLFGVEAHLESLAAQALSPAPPWIIAIEGIGGVGKTALADALTRRLIDVGDWADVSWVTARQQIFDGGGAIEAVAQPRLSAGDLVDEMAQQLLFPDFDPHALTLSQKTAFLQERLRHEPHLLVVDNLETLIDVSALLTTLRGFADPSKILLTSRASRLYEKDIYHFVVPELGQADAFALLRHEARVRNAPGLAAASDADLQSIFDAVGGNPLALRLVVGQLLVHPLARVLDDLRQARGRQVRELYTFIYRQAWSDLDARTQQVLLLMPLVTENGGDLDYLTAMAAANGLSASEVGDALVQLVSRNLVDARGELHQRRYTIHPLTRLFLQQEILRWPVSGLGFDE